MVESIINDSLMKQIEEISRRQGLSFAEACQILVEHGVSLLHESDMLSGSVNRLKMH